jgi:tryptophan halogenase
MSSRKSGKIQKIAILGGGTAGWLSALYLREGLAEDTEITLIESPRVGIIGVGEATIPTIRLTMAMLGFDEPKWMPHAEATYKLAVRFENWLRNDGHVFYHPFHQDKELVASDLHIGLYPDLPSKMDLIQAYAAIPAEKRDLPFAFWASPIPALCERAKAPHPRPGTSHEGLGRAINYAYHFDTFLLGKHLKEAGIERGIGYIEDHFVDGELDEQGFIQALRLESGKRVEADLYLDCTGFSAKLIGGLLKEPFLPVKAHLPCDAAVALAVPHPDPCPPLRPYTNAVAQDAGWIWEIPLRHRTGSGYVYSSAHLGKDEAEARLRRFHGEDRVRDIQARHIPMRTGRHRQAWVKNCVAIGLAASFIEPLESTSIGITEYQLFTLLGLFPDRSFPDALARRYNERFAHCYDQTRDYIFLHYSLSQRKDTPFWRDVQRLAAPETMSEFLSSVEEWIASPKAERDYAIFMRFNFACILAGMDRLPDFRLPLIEHRDQEAIARHAGKIRERRMKLVAELPGHLEYLLASEALTAR